MKNLNDGYAKIITDETLRETISHGSEEYPFRYYYEIYGSLTCTVLTGTGTPRLSLCL